MNETCIYFHSATVKAARFAIIESEKGIRIHYVMNIILAMIAWSTRSTNANAVVEAEWRSLFMRLL